MDGGFIPYRRDVEFIPSEEADILTPLQNSLSEETKSWGIVFRFGFFEIPKEDFETITKKMKANN